MTPLRILVVEDEMTIALMVEDMLTEMGHQVVGLAMRLPQAEQLADSLDIDLAILDINLDGRRSFPVADILTRRGVPVIFASGYGSAGLEPPYLDRLVVRKPFESRDLQGAIRQGAAG